MREKRRGIGFETVAGMGGGYLVETLFPTAVFISFILYYFFYTFFYLVTTGWIFDISLFV